MPQIIIISATEQKTELESSMSHRQVIGVTWG